MPERCNGSLRPTRGMGPAPRPWRGAFVRDPALERALVGAASAPRPGDLEDYHSAVPMDLDGDGDDDLVVNHRRGESAWLRNDGRGAYTLAGPLPGGRGDCFFAEDLDNDGRRDLWCARRHGVLWGTPTGVTFSEEPPLPHVPFDCNGVTVWDVDEDGLLDVVTATFAPETPVLRNLGNRNFQDVAGVWGLQPGGLRWVTVPVDLDEDGRRDLVLFNDGEGVDQFPLRALGPDGNGEPRFARLEPTPRECDQRGVFGRGTAGPMGATLGDVDLDGHDELYVALSYNDTLFTRREGRWLDTAEALRLPEPIVAGGLAMVRWSPYFWDIDHDGWLDLLVPGGNDQAMTPGRQVGVSYVMLLRGAPDGRFEELHTPAGLTGLGDYNGLCLWDRDRDGDLDLLVGGMGAPTAAYENRVEGANHLLVSLRGTFSNPSGRGARVTVTAGALRRSYGMGDQYGLTAFGPPVVDAALGEATRADRVEVLWPSGVLQVAENVPADQPVTLTEPAVVALSGPRHLRADGRSTLDLRVVPSRLRPGAPADATVSIEASAGAARWTGPVRPLGDGAFARTLTAPDTPGSVVLTVRVGATTLGVRPRVWFDPG